ncbi:MAG: N-acetyl-gamma-glutamyl-phosphate reductase [Flavobacteriaceae bacterium]|nr:N-acetyl-gamma-glutamyl-phosphate reductase [Flavobacteriaceae bacterium]
MSITNKIKVGIVGGSGYTGGELIRLLINHPNVDISFINSKTYTGKKVVDIHKDLIGELEMKFIGKIKDCDVMFLCLGHNKSEEFLRKTFINRKTKIIDLSQDYRLEKSFIGDDEKRDFIYGLPELYKNEIKTAKNISNPGCFATAIEISLIPSIEKKYIHGEVHTNAITGSTGAGVVPSKTTHFSWRNNNVSNYNVFNHRHLNEIYLHLNQICNEVKINFIPIRGNFSRGIFCTSYFKSDVTVEEINEVYKIYYKNHPFVHISENEISLKEVINTNKCILHLSKVNDKILITSIIDNLIKGASGQAIQNMNLISGFEEMTGLKLKSSIF